MGTFDGQGHNQQSCNEFLFTFGLFWSSSAGATIKNIVLDSSCTAVSSYSGSSSSYAYIGGIIGECYGCTIENTVNMASVSFTGSTSSSLYLDGVAGYLYYSKTVKNCANYGSVTHYGTAKNAYIGGIVGYFG